MRAPIKACALSKAGFAAALALAALGLPSPALAQAGASPYTSASRYDAMRRVTGTIAADPDGAGALPFLAVRNTYDVQGQLTKVETGELAAWQSDAVAPSAWTGFTVRRTIETSHDTMGRKLRETLREGPAGPIQSVTQYSYDSFGRLECTALRMNPAIYGSLPTSACTPGTAGTQGPDRIARTVYDAAGQRLQLREGVGSADEGTEATWAYNLNGQVTTVIDGNGNRADLRYDGHGRQDRWTFPSTTRASAFNDATPATALSTAGSVNANDYEAYSYDPNGNRTNLRKRDGRNIAFAYDALGRVTAKTYPQGGATAVYYGYDLRGLQMFARFDSTSGQGITNAYDGFGRLASTSTNMGGTARALAYLHDSNGNRIRITHPDGAYFRSDYDGLSRPASIWENGATNMSGFTYYAHGAVSGLSRANGTASGFGYDALQRLSGMVQYLPGTAHDATWNYGRNPAGGIASTSRDNDVYAWTGHYATARAYTTNGLNQYSAAGGTSLGYDANGNLTTSGSSSYAYDIENRMVGAPNNIALTYDPLGRLFQVANTSTGAATRFLYDGDALVAEYNAAGVMQRRYVHNVGADVPLLSYAGSNLSLPSYLHADERGSIVAISDPWGAGSVNSYDEYGIPGAGNAGRFQYTGQIWLAELGMYYYKARIYSPTLGRFMQTDPVAYDDQFNLYAYVGNDPVNHSDPDGRQILDSHERDSAGLSRWKEQARDAMMEGARQAAIAGYNLIATLYFAPIGGAEEASVAPAAAGGRAVVTGEVRAVARVNPGGRTFTDATGRVRTPSTGGPGAGQRISPSTRAAERAASGNRCIYCGKGTTNTPRRPNSSQGEHMAPMNPRGGGPRGNNTPENTGNGCAQCNLSKNNRDPIEWIRETFGGE